jgi:hypothetical protein
MEVHRREPEFLDNGVKLPVTAPTTTPEQVQGNLHAFVSRNRYGCD